MRNAETSSGKPDPNLAVTYSSSADPSVRQVIETLQPFKALSPEARVVIKPNIVLSRKRWLGANTRPEIVESLVVLLREQGVRNITIADGSGIGESATRAFKICGYTEIADKHGVRLVDIDRDRFIERSTLTDGPFSKLALSQTVADCDYLINVPVIKAHCQTRVTCSLKNLKGVMPRQLKSSFHGADLERAIAQLAALVTPDFVLADGTYGDLSSELGGKPVNLGIIAGGRDPLTVDCFAASTLGFSPAAIAHIAHYARARGVDPAAFQPVLHELNHPSGDRVFETDTDGFRAYPCTVQLGNTCCTCHGNLRFALERMREARVLSGEDHYYIGSFGTAAEAAGEKRAQQHCRAHRAIAVGDCARAAVSPPAEIAVPGCPPSADAIVRAVRNAKAV